MTRDEDTLRKLLALAASATIPAERAAALRAADKVRARTIAPRTVMFDVGPKSPPWQWQAAILAQDLSGARLVVSGQGLKVTGTPAQVASAEGWHTYIAQRATCKTATNAVRLAIVLTLRNMLSSLKRNPAGRGYDDLSADLSAAPPAERAAILAALDGNTDPQAAALRRQYGSPERRP